MQELGWGDQYYDARGDIFLHAGGINRPPFFNNACVGRYGNGKLKNENDRSTHK